MKWNSFMKLIRPLAVIAAVAGLLLFAGPAAADSPAIPASPCAKADEHALGNAQFVERHCPTLIYYDGFFAYPPTGSWQAIEQVVYCRDAGGAYDTGGEFLAVRALDIPIDPALGVGQAEVAGFTVYGWTAIVTFEVPPEGGAVHYRVYCV